MNQGVYLGGGHLKVFQRIIDGLPIGIETIWWWSCAEVLP